MASQSVEERGENQRRPHRRGSIREEPLKRTNIFTTIGNRGTSSMRDQERRWRGLKVFAAGHVKVFRE